MNKRRRSPEKVPAVLEPVVAAVGRSRGVSIERGWGAGTITLKASGRIFAMAQGDELVLKLPKARVDALVEASSGKRFDPRRDGRLMKEWIVLSRQRNDWVDLAREALRFVVGDL